MEIRNIGICTINTHHEPGTETGTESREPRGKIGEPGTDTREPRTGNPEQGTGDRGPGIGNRGPGTRNRDLEPGANQSIGKSKQTL